MLIKKKDCIKKWDEIKNGKLLTSHRSTVYPCYLPVLGEFNRSWSYKTCQCKYRIDELKKLDDEKVF